MQNLVVLSKQTCKMQASNYLCHKNTNFQNQFQPPHCQSRKWWFFVCSICPIQLLSIRKSCLVLQNKLPTPQAHFAKNRFVVTKQFAKFSTDHQNPRCQAHALFVAIFQGLTQPKPRAILLVFLRKSVVNLPKYVLSNCKFFCKTAKLFSNLFSGQLGLHTMHKR